jgi:hypothetical protein
VSPEILKGNIYTLKAKPEISFHARMCIGYFPELLSGVYIGKVTWTAGIATALRASRIAILVLYRRRVYNYPSFSRMRSELRDNFSHSLTEEFDLQLSFQREP